MYVHIFSAILKKAAKNERFFSTFLIILIKSTIAWSCFTLFMRFYSKMYFQGKTEKEYILKCQSK